MSPLTKTEKKTRRKKREKMTEHKLNQWMRYVTMSAMTIRTYAIT